MLLAPLIRPEGGLPQPPRRTILWWAAFGIRWLIAVVATVAFFLLCVVLVPRPALWSTGLHGIALEGFLFALFYGAIAVHEVGHLIGARAVGFQIVSMSVGPLIIDRTGVHLSAKSSLFSGRAKAGLQHWEGEAVFGRQYAWFVAAGPAASIISGVAAGAIALLLVWHVDPQSDQHVAAGLWFGAVLSIMIGLFALIPMPSSAGRTSDGEKLLRLRQSPRQAITALQLASFTQRPRDWDATLLARVREDLDNHTDGAAVDGALLLSYHYLDAEDPAHARDAIQQAIDIACEAARTKPGLIALGRSIGIRLAIEAALFEAAWRGDFKAGGDWLGRPPLTPETATRLARAGRPWSEKIRATTIAHLAAHTEPTSPLVL